MTVPSGDSNAEPALALSVVAAFRPVSGADRTAGRSSPSERRSVYRESSR
jgi:hypothetical protein